MPARRERGHVTADIAKHSERGGASDAVDGDVLTYFPFTRVRPGQRALLTDVTSAITGHRHLVASAPTGIGKTAAVLAPAIQAAHRHGLRVLFLTSKQSHHRIAVETLRAIALRSSHPLRVVDIVGKRSMCPRPEARLPPSVFTAFCRNVVARGRCPYHRTDPSPLVRRLATANLHAQEFVDVVSGGGVCPHRAALLLGAGSTCIVCDYNYVFSDIAGSVLEAMKVDLSRSIVIVDEAHNLPDRIIDRMSVWISERTVGDAAVALRRHPDLRRAVLALGSWLERAIGEVDPGEEAMIDRGGPENAISAALRERIDDVMDLSDLIAAMRVLQLPPDPAVHVERIARFLEIWTGAPEGTIRYVSRRDMDRAVVELLDPSIVSGNVFREVHTAVLMSGTLHPLTMYADVLGLPADRTDLRGYPNPFPAENVLIVAVTTLTSRFTERGMVMYNRYAGLISSIVRAVPGSIAVYFPSYELMDDVSALLDSEVRARTLPERPGMSKEEREALYEGILSSGDDRVLLGVVGGPLAEGMDFRGNALKAVVVVGLPLPPRTLAVESKEMYFDERFGHGKGRRYAYYHPTMNHVVQAAGRMIRSEVDRGAVVLLDERYRYPMYRECFPPDFRYMTTDDPLPLLEGFFSGDGSAGARLTER